VAAFAEANFWDVRAQNHSFKEVAAFHYDEANLTGDGPAEKVTARSITVGFFRTLGVSPVLGRDFSYTDDRNGFNNRVVILGNKFWRSRFGADPNIIGKTLRLNDRACVVVGVLPPVPVNLGLTIRSINRLATGQMPSAGVGNSP
jgi:MacB-like periplasmic core domain